MNILFVFYQKNLSLSVTILVTFYLFSKPYFNPYFNVTKTLRSV